MSDIARTVADEILKVHVEAPSAGHTFCVECGTGYPCATVRAVSRATGRQEIGRLGPSRHALVIGIDEGDVLVGTVYGLWSLDKADRELFQRLFMEAERQAEAWAAEHGEAS